MSRRLFGTDGIRAPFGEAPLDRATVTDLGAHLTRLLAEEGGSGNGTGSGTDRGRAAGRAPEVVLGGDTRDSTPTLARWLADGIEAEGGRWRYVGVVPTGAVAHLVPSLGADGGAVLSASHNPWPDNGIKLLDARGFKWSEAAERRLEGMLGESPAAPLDDTGSDDTGSDDTEPGDTEPDDTEREPLEPEGGLVERYLDSLVHTIAPDPAAAGSALGGLRVLLDTGNGAASRWAGPLFERCGARVGVLHDRPDGRNINAACGATDTADLAAAMTADGASWDLGVAFDGDADRAILVDRQGRERDGDAILYLWARDLAERGALDPAAVVATSMSNLGLERALDERGIELVRCGVGDRQVVEALRREGLVLGGEQSGHVVHLGLSTTGDGVLTALQVAAVLARRGRSLEELLEGFERYPQVLVNVQVRQKPDLETLPEVMAEARRVEEALGRDGRLLLRYSGTEPKARVMIEGPDRQVIEELAEGLAEEIRRVIGT